MPSSDERLIDALPALVLVTRADGSVDLANQRWVDFTGISKNRAQAFGWTEAIDPGMREHATELVRRLVLAGESGEAELRLQRSDGSSRWFMMRIAPHGTDASGSRSVATFFDVDDSHQREERLGASERAARLIIDFIPALIATMSPAGEVEFANQPTIDYLGQNLDELKRWAFSAAVHADDLSRVVDAWGQSVATGKPYDIEHRIRGADGVYRWFHVRGRCQRDAEGRIVRWYNILTDVDEQHRAEQALEAAVTALRTSERELSLIVETIPGLVWCAAPDGSITYINKRILEYFGASFEVVRGTWHERIHAEEREAVVRAWSRSVETGEPFSFSQRLRGKEGFYRWMQSMAQLGRDEKGAPTRWYGLVIDIDDYRHADEALSETRARLMRAAQVATIAELSASIAHEINQPLTSVVSSGQACQNWLAADPPNLENARRAADRIVRDGTQAGEIILRLRKLFKRGPLNRVPLSMNDLVGDVVDVVRRDAARRQVLLRIELEPSLPAVSGDRVQLQQVVLNLLNNALDAMEGVVTRARAILIRTACIDGSVVVEVADSGIGLADPSKVFEPFFTTKPHGLGMGLAICRWIIEAHDGRLWATNRDGLGASFSFSIPVGRPC